MRFLINEIDRPELTSAYEEAMVIAREKDLTEDFIWFWKHPKVVYLVKNATIDHVGEDYVRKMKYPINRSNVFGGTPKSVVIAGDDYSILACIKNAPFDFKKTLYTELWAEIAKDLGIDAEFIKNDVVIKKTTRKLLGMVYRNTEGYESGHCMFSVTTPQVDLSKVFLMPNSSEGMMFNPLDRISDIQKETGRVVDKNTILDMVRKKLTENGVVLEDSTFSQEELDLVRELTPLHLSEKWIRYADNGED